jgi:hypothetical protein
MFFELFPLTLFQFCLQEQDLKNTVPRRIGATL